MQQQLQTRRPAMPTATRYAIIAMYVGIACSLVTALAAFVDQAAAGGVADELRREYPKYTADEIGGEESATITYLYVLSAIGVACWFWMVQATRRAWRGTRVTATVLLALGLCIASANAYVPMPGFLGLTVWLPCIAGAVAVFFLWKRDSATYLARSGDDAPAQSS